MGMYLTRSETLSEELVQDVFLKVWKNRDQLPALHYFNAWLRTIASNTCSNYLRSMAIERLALTQLVSEQSVSVESAEEGVIGIGNQKAHKNPRVVIDFCQVDGCLAENHRALCHTSNGYRSHR